ncbi:hypothetical protein AOZ06_32400 [Kibdelosporangium phytohabitans]|uniref:Beta-xylosidase C-terminal Concanavalin A-like domain-containing protein n=1 Tax=Kibdelosporangium phytohabitans TaxID=860235 RepID=A0A0N9HUK1_9PSEU|nr:hypothetical protein AOZ06_32400 [Kibdelosporangium phytohabitans]
MALLVVAAAVLVFKYAAHQPGCQPWLTDFASAGAVDGLNRMNDRGGRSTYDFIEGRLEMTAQPGSDVGGEVTAPFLYTTVPADFTVQTEVFADPSAGYQAAGLLVFEDARTHVRLERGSGDVIAYHHQGGRVTVPVSAANVELRLSRHGNRLDAEWRDTPNNGHWQSLGPAATLTKPVRVGVTALNATSDREPFTAAFRYLRITCP